MQRLLVLVGALVGCQAFKPPPEIEGGVEILLRQYQGWSSAKIKPPYMVGPSVSLRMAKGELSGVMAGLRVNVRLEPGGLTGMISGRPVEIDVDRTTGEIDLQGTWYGATARLIATDDRLRASVPTRNGRCCIDFNFERVLHNAPPGYVVFVDQHQQFYGGAVLEIPQQMLGWYSTPEVALLVFAFLFSAGG